MHYSCVKVTSSDALTGTDAAVTTATVTNGGHYNTPLRGYQLKTLHTEAQVWPIYIYIYEYIITGDL